MDSNMYQPKRRTKGARQCFVSEHEKQARSQIKSRDTDSGCQLHIQRNWKYEL